MRPTITTWLSLAGALLAAAGSPDAAGAQYRLPALVSSVTADSLHAQAVAFAQSGRWNDAAQMYRRSAELREIDDPRGYIAFRSAAHVGYAAGNLSGAREDMTRAAAQALVRGDLKDAAMAYADAAWVAKEQNRGKLVWELGRRAEILAMAPLLSPEDRKAILSRFSRGPETGAVAAR